MTGEQIELELPRDFDAERARRAIEELLDLGLDVYEVAERLNAREMPAPDGDPWTGWLVREFLRETGGRS